MKAKIRQQALRQRKSLTAGEVEEKSRRIARRLFTLPEFKRARTVMFYVSRPEEVRTHEMIRAAIGSGYRVSVPFTGAKSEKIVPVAIEDMDRELSPGRWGILEPVSDESKIALEELDLVILPGVAFDGGGNRLGRGQAFYDTFLKKAHPRTGRIALAFETQIYEKVPSCGHDVSMNKVITENRVIVCSGEEESDWKI